MYGAVSRLVKRCRPARREGAEPASRRPSAAGRALRTYPEGGLALGCRKGILGD